MHFPVFDPMCPMDAQGEEWPRKDQIQLCARDNQLGEGPMSSNAKLSLSSHRLANHIFAFAAFWPGSSSVRHVGIVVNSTFWKIFPHNHLQGFLEHNTVLRLRLSHIRFELFLQGMIVDRARIFHVRYHIHMLSFPLCKLDVMQTHQWLLSSPSDSNENFHLHLIFARYA